MTFATKLTVLRLCLVPVFVGLAIVYGLQTHTGNPSSTLKWASLSIFTFAALTDALDGWIARKFDQKSDLGAFLDPIADKSLVLSAVILLATLDWGRFGWGMPVWFASIVFLRECVILIGILYMWRAKRNVAIRPHWSGKICTFSLFFVLGWVMLGPFPLSPIYPCALVSVFVIISVSVYIQQGIRIMKGMA